MASDWGSAFPGQEVSYVIAVRNTRASGELTNVTISSALPANVEILSADSDRTPDPQVAGNRVTLNLASLPANQGVEVQIKTRVRGDVAVGTRVVAQAELSFGGLTIPAYSNIVTVLVVGPAQAAQGPSTATPTATATTTAAASATAAASPTAGATQTIQPAGAGSTSVIGNYPTAEAPTQVIAQAASSGAPTAPATNLDPARVTPGAPLPATSTGLPPLIGFTMLGATLGLRTWRLKRARERI
jgi:uncharacterized repeat protein (TIGR01451 family)